MPEIRVLICDDHAILRDGIRTLLERQDDIRVVGEAANGREALARVADLRPDIVLMDVAMPELDGIQATRLIKQHQPDVKVLILTQHDDREYVGSLLQAGASGYVLKRSGGHEVIMALHQVYEQGVYLAPSITRRVLEDYTQKDSADRDNMPPLTERERDVLRLVVEGKSNKEIASLLSISPKTVSVHRSNIMSKLGLHNSVEMLRYVTQHHLFDVGPQ